MRSMLCRKLVFFSGDSGFLISKVIFLSRCLDVCGCVKVTDHGVRALARSCNRLNSLDLSSTSITQKRLGIEIETHVFMALFVQCRLQVLTHVSPYSVLMLANYCSQNLQSLKLSFCVDVTDDSVSRLVRHCKR